MLVKVMDHKIVLVVMRVVLVTVFHASINVTVDYTEIRMAMHHPGVQIQLLDRNVLKFYVVK